MWVTRLIEHSISHQLLWCIVSFLLRNPPLLTSPQPLSSPKKINPLKRVIFQVLKSFVQLAVFANGGAVNDVKFIFAK